MLLILFFLSLEYVLVFDVVKINFGNVYYFSIGVFIVLVLGVYVFIWIFWIGGNYDYSIQLMVNREDVGIVYFYIIGGVDVEVIGIVVVYVNVGDDVFV